MLESISHKRAYDSTISHHSGEGRPFSHPKDSEKDVSCYFILVRNGGLEVAEVRVWVENGV